MRRTTVNIPIGIRHQETLSFTTVTKIVGSQVKQMSQPTEAVDLQRLKLS